MSEERTKQLLKQMADLKSELDIEIKITDTKSKLIIGRNLTRLRKAKKYTQEQVAVALGIQRTQYTNIELGTCWLHVRHIIRVCELLNALPNDILVDKANAISVRKAAEIKYGYHENHGA